MIHGPFIAIQEIENELQKMQQIAESFRPKFLILSQQVAYIFSQIKSCETIKQANPYFEVLEKIHSGLARLVYEYNIGILSGRLDRFVEDFDNLELHKEYYFKKITSGEYSY